MTILSVIKDVCANVGVLVPTSVFASLASNRTMQEMVALANEMAQRIAYDHREWTTMRATATFVGDGVTASFNLPANYKRMLLRSNVWSSTRTQWPMTFIPNGEDWLRRRASNTVDGSGEWTIFGGQMHIQPVMAGPVTYPAPLPSWWLNGRDYVIGETAADAGDLSSWSVIANHTSAATGTFAEDRAPPNDGNWAAMPVAPPIVSAPAQTAYFNYLDKNCVALASGGFGDIFLADGDSFRLDERILKLGMIWQWKANKGTAYAEDMGTYGDALNTYAGFDQPQPIIVSSRRGGDSWGWGHAF